VVLLGVLPLVVLYVPLVSRLDPSFLISFVYFGSYVACWVSGSRSPFHFPLSLMVGSGIF